ncbi:MAG TPA: alpha/beta hydrolase [Saprospiraceae bacterium]|nr:alpha/beta hydrolase [Saprospiraceae bacterium]MCC6687505.1 alpha/beta hydrolase [Saprospiraceae bacterium]HMV23163.1 alpha/beta hydrolase [Saprospiraceae bacterium]HMW74002.1 alpha/beta hydrolase [Saprospiraceae bacterium]HMX81702.1 alpha/beta hydrolase [Saprospiraceae bacterium]
MEYELIEEFGFKYIETNGGKETLVLLHGLLGALSNFEGIMKEFHDRYNVVIPILPIMELPMLKLSVGGLVDHVYDFIRFKNFDKVHVLGNSLGGHISILFALAHPQHVATITLTGSSGLFESAMGTSFPKRGSYEYIEKKAQETFYDPAVATKELVDEIFSTISDRLKALRIVVTSKSAVRQNLEHRLHEIEKPTLLIWGHQDIVTPPFVGEKFHSLIKNSELHFIDKSGHAPMMERPEEFNAILSSFLDRNRLL